VFFIVGPTATGKSELAADVARHLDAEIVSADAFQIYRGPDLLTAKPDSTTLAKAPHHLISTTSISEEMNAEKFRQLALRAIAEIHSRKRFAVVVGGSGLYVKALTHGLTSLPPANPELRAQLNELTLEQLREKLVNLNPDAADKIDLKNRRRVVRAIEICLTTTGRRGAATSLPAEGPSRTGGLAKAGIFVFRDREELYQRINRRVEAMFALGVIEEVRAAVAGATQPISLTASQMIGLSEIRRLIAGKITEAEAIAAIQQTTRRFAKRQLTWFRHQANFESLNLSLLTHQEAVARILQKARLAAAQGND